MLSKSSSAALLDIPDNIYLCRQFIAGMSYQAFCEDFAPTSRLDESPLSKPPMGRYSRRRQHLSA
jgi:hypothetical protein